MFAPPTRVQRDTEHERLARVGCALLQHGHLARSGAASPLWSSLLPQLSHAVPAVNAAAAALGAVYDASVLATAGSGSGTIRAARQYGIALHVIQHDLVAQPHGSMPLLLSCVLLACTEVLQWRSLNALAHLQGALKVLCQRDASASSSFGTDDSTDGKNHGAEVSAFAPQDELDVLLAVLDIQAASYALGQPPNLPELDMQPLLSIPQSMRSASDLELHVIQTIHSGYRFAHTASHHKYLPHASVPPSLAIQQGRHIARLRLCLSLLSVSCRPVPGLPAPPARPPLPHRQSLILRTHCLATLIYLSSTTQPHEGSYDAHAASFRQIILDGQAVLSAPSSSAQRAGLGHFSPGLGVLQPLFITALKYREPAWRRQAIAMLGTGGRDGPWCGRVLAAVAARAVQIEEVGGGWGEGRGELAGTVGERERLHGCGIDLDAVGDGVVDLGVTFSRCADVERMLGAASGWGDESNWHIWTEKVAF